MRRLLIALAVLAALSAVPASASAGVKWLCRPGLVKSPCTPSLKTTVFSGWGQKLRVETPKLARKPKVDCFYVYPTVSNETQTLADRRATPEIRDIALYQASQFSQVCRVFAPIYRQITVEGLTRAPTAAQRATGDRDLLAAWREYLARYNRGRGVVLIGHSQGSFRLTTLIQRQIDKNAKVRRRLLSAILLGGNETVQAGSDRGGSFQNVPTCKTTTQLHCLIAFSTFNQTPPDDTIFGRTATPGLQVACTNPAALQGGSADLDSIVPTKPFAPGTLLGAGVQLLHFPLPKVSTPFIEAKAAFSGECTTENGATFLKVTSLGGTPVPTASPTPQWGLHLLDAQVAQGDLIALVRSQAAAYTH